MLPKSGITRFKAITLEVVSLNMLEQGQTILVSRTGQEVRNLATKFDATEALNCGAVTLKKPYSALLLLLKLTYTYCLIHVHCDN
jgi:hypothetical protein